MIEANKRQRIAISFRREGHGTWQPTNANWLATKTSLTIPRLASLAKRIAAGRGPA
jgi:hypothetical protein